MRPSILTDDGLRLVLVHEAVHALDAERFPDSFRELYGTGRTSTVARAVLPTGTPFMKGVARFW